VFGVSNWLLTWVVRKADHSACGERQKAEAKLTDKIYLVTANAGIGKVTAVGLAKVGATEVMVCLSAA